MAGSKSGDPDAKLMGHIKNVGMRPGTPKKNKSPMKEPKWKQNLESAMMNVKASKSQKKGVKSAPNVGNGN
jgi:hypothetical protein